MTIDNLQPRLDTAGAIVNGHDGTVRWFDGYWWMHSAQYGECADPPLHGCDMTGPTRGTSCGFEPNHNVSIYRSPDMSSGSWEFVGLAVECAKLSNCGILYRPHLVFHPRSQRYLLYWNYVNKQGQYAGNGLAAAASPAGPFTLVAELISTTFPTGDFDVLVDDDGTGYIIYSAMHLMFLEELSPQMNGTTGTGAKIVNGNKGPFPLPNPNNLQAFPVDFVEAPVLFKRGKVYYALFGHCCCFCFQGSGMYVFTAPTPLGPWVQQGTEDLGCVANSSNPTPAEQHSLPLTAVLTPGQGCNYQHAVAASTSRAQQNFVVTVETGNGKDFIWTGDRWMQAADGIKGHEPQFWARLEFDSQDRVQPLRWVDNVTISMVLPQ